MKKQALLVRLFALVLVCAMMAVAFVGCTNDKDSEETKDTQEKVTGPATDANGLIMDNLPDVNFGRTFHILGEEKYKNQYFGVEEGSNDAVHPVIFKRNETVQERLGVEFEWSHAQGDWGARETFIKEVETSVKGGGTVIDATICYNLVPQVIAERGMAANLYGTKYLDLTGPWWPQVYVNEMVVNDTIYGLVESNDYGLLKNMMAMFFNNDMLESRSLESPYDLVKNNEWTIDKLAELIKDTYEDTNGNSKVDVNEDTFGVCTATAAKRDAWLFGLGFKLSEVQNDEIVSNVNESYFLPYIDRMLDFYSTDDAYKNDSAQHKMFVEERVYFYCAGVLLTNEIKNKDLDINYGVVPMPKLTSDQDRYYTHLSNTHDAWCVPVSASDMDVSSAVLECMASEAYRSIGPTYYDSYVKLRFAPDERLSDMYDLIRESVTFDFVYLYSCVYSSNPKDLVKSCITKPEENVWGSVFASNSPNLTASFEKIVSLYSK